MATFVLFHEFANHLGKKLINLQATDVFKWVLVPAANTPSQANDTQLSNITQIANGNGYTTGGTAEPVTTYAETGAGTGIWQFGTASSGPTWTASGGSIATFQYAVLYDDTATNDELVGYLDYGSTVTITVGNTFTIDVGANGIFRIS